MNSSDISGIVKALLIKKTINVLLRLSTKIPKWAILFCVLLRVKNIRPHYASYCSLARPYFSIYEQFKALSHSKTIKIFIEPSGARGLVSEVTVHTIWCNGKLKNFESSKLCTSWSHPNRSLIHMQILKHFREWRKLTTCEGEVSYKI